MLTTGRPARLYFLNNVDTANSLNRYQQKIKAFGNFFVERETSIISYEEIIKHNIYNVKLQPNICDI